jgi:hypothetical protein
MRSGGEGGVSREGGRARRAEIQSRLLGALAVDERGVSRENGVSREGGQARRVQVDKRLLWVLAIAAGAVLTLFVLWIGPWLFTRHPALPSLTSRNSRPRTMFARHSCKPLRASRWPVARSSPIAGSGSLPRRCSSSPKGGSRRPDTASTELRPTRDQWIRSLPGRARSRPYRARRPGLHFPRHAGPHSLDATVQLP